MPSAGSVASSSTLHTVLDSQILATLRGTDIREMEQLGVMEGSSLLQFGEIGDAIRDSDGNLLVLDGQASELRWFRNETGRIVAESGRLIGGAGLGPGEFQSPLALAAGSTGLVGVFDSGGRVHLFIPDDQGLRHLRSLQLRMDILDACILGDRLILAGYHADHSGALHVFTDTGDWVRSFGLFYESNNRWVREALHRAEVACLEEAGEVLVAPSFLPEIRKYKVSGSLVWWIALEGLAPILIVETRGGRVGIGPPVGGYHATLGLVADEEMGVAVVQVAHITQRGRNEGEMPELLTYAIDLDVGNGGMIGNTVPELHDLYAGGAVWSRRLPFPTVGLVSWMSTEVR